MKALGRILRGERKCEYCGESTGGWSNTNNTCRRHRSMEHSIMNSAIPNGRKMRGHRAMPARVQRRMNRKLGLREPRED